MSYEREHIDNGEEAKKITLKNLETNPLYYQEKYSKTEYEKRVNRIEKEKRKKKESETSTNI
jgi:hypothetical protein